LYVPLPPCGATTICPSLPPLQVTFVTTVGMVIAVGAFIVKGTEYGQEPSET